MTDFEKEILGEIKVNKHKADQLKKSEIVNVVKSQRE